MKSVLVIDDNSFVRQFLCYILEREGYAVYGADNGRVGISLYRANPTDLVITDIYMPVKNGIDTIRELKQEFPAVKIIAMSGGHIDLLSEAQALGAQHMLVKPFSRKELVGAIQQVVHLTTAPGTGSDLSIVR